MKIVTEIPFTIGNDFTKVEVSADAQILNVLMKPDPFDINQRKDRAVLVVLHNTESPKIHRYIRTIVTNGELPAELQFKYIGTVAIEAANYHVFEQEN